MIGLSPIGYQPFGKDVALMSLTVISASYSQSAPAGDLEVEFRSPTDSFVGGASSSFQSQRTSGIVCRVGLRMIRGFCSCIMAIFLLVHAQDTSEHSDDLGEGEDDEDIFQLQSSQLQAPVMFLGNPGKGKSTLANCLAREILFKAGTTHGEGLTTSVEEKANGHGKFIDTPGLADVDAEIRRRAAVEIARVLQKGGDYRIVFVITVEQSRIHEEDKSTIKIVLDAAEQIAGNYAIVVNQCAPGFIRKIQDKIWRQEFEANLLSKLPFTSNIFYCKREEALECEDNAMVSMPKLCKFIYDVPVAELQPGACRDIPTDNFHSVCEQLKQSREELQRYLDRLREVERDRSEFFDEKAVSRRLGIQLDWVLNEFPSTVQRIHSQRASGRCLNSLVKKSIWKMNFLELAPLAAYGDDALGKGKRCPRDGNPDCSIVDAVHEEGYSEQATVFLSWVWKYDLKLVHSSLQQWARTSAVSVKISFVWWCFFQNNQFRILQNKDVQSPEQLSDIFGPQLNQVGRMISMMNRIRDSDYLRRIWCVYEIFVAKEHNIHIDIILPESAQLELDGIFRKRGIRGVDDIIQIDVAMARATYDADEKAIKELITKKSSFSAVNEKASKALEESLRIIIFDRSRQPQPQERARATRRICFCVVLSLIVLLAVGGIIYAQRHGIFQRQ